MGILDKVAFWKKKDEFGDLGGDLGDDLGSDLGGDLSGDLNSGLDQSNQMQADLPPGLEMTDPMMTEQNPQNVENVMGPSETLPDRGGLQPQQGFNPADPNAANQYQAASPYPTQQPNLQPGQMQGGGHEMMSKDIEVVSSKLDALRAAIDSLNQRVINIEHLVREEKENKYKW